MVAWLRSLILSALASAQAVQLGSRAAIVNLKPPAGTECAFKKLEDYGVNLTLFQEDVDEIGGDFSDDFSNMCNQNSNNRLSLVNISNPMPMMWIHIHKVGGSFICGAAYLNGERVVEPNGNCNWNPHDGGAGSVYLERTSCKNRTAHFKENHYSWGQVERVLADEMCFDDFDYGIWLRDPVSLAESEVNHAKYTAEQVKQHMDCFNTTCFSVLSQDHMPLWMYFDNYVIRAVLGPSVYNLPPGKITLQHAEKALNMLLKFQVVIIMEQALEDQSLLLDSVGWTKWPLKGDTSNPQGLRIRGPHKVVFTKEQAEMVRKRNKFDYMIYNHFAKDQNHQVGLNHRSRRLQSGRTMQDIVAKRHTGGDDARHVHPSRIVKAGGAERHVSRQKQGA